MNLSQYKDVDALVLDLARLGFVPFTQGFIAPYQSHYHWIDWYCPLCQSSERAVSIWPAVDLDGEVSFDDVGANAVIHNGEIGHWEIVETWAGTATPIRKPEEVELDRLGDFLAETARRWGASKA